MFIYKAPNAAGSKISVTATATNIFNLINTAASTSANNAGYPGVANSIMIQPEDGSIRVLFDGNTPTATNGFLITQGTVATFANVPLARMLLIRTGGSNVACSIQIGRSDAGESSILAGGGTIAGSVTVDSEFPAAAAASDAYANPTTTDVKSFMMGYNGTTWDRIRTAIAAATSTLTGLLNTFSGGIYNTSKPTATNGQYVPNQVNVNGALDVNEVGMPQAEDNVNFVYAVRMKPIVDSTYTWSVDQSAALEASTVTKAAAGTLRKIEGRIDASAGSDTYYIQILNHASVPSDGAVTHLIPPKKIIHTTSSDSNFSIDLGEAGISASTGIVIVLSSTEFTKTISSALLSTYILYK